MGSALHHFRGSEIEYQTAWKRLEVGCMAPEGHNGLDDKSITTDLFVDTGISGQKQNESSLIRAIFVDDRVEYQAHPRVSFQSSELRT